MFSKIFGKKNYEVNPDDFLTTVYKEKYLRAIEGIDSSKKRYNIYMNLIEEEVNYYNGICDAIYYCENLKTKVGSLANQLKNYYLIDNNE